MWQSLGEFTPSNQWMYSHVIEENFISLKLSHNFVADASRKELAAAVALMYDDESSLYKPKSFTWRDKAEIIDYSALPIKQKPRVGIKRLDNANLIWNIKVEIMPIYETGHPSKSENIDAICSQIAITTNLDGVVQSNLNRRNLTIYNPSPTATIFIGCALKREEDGSGGFILSLASFLSIIKPGKVYELPTAGDGRCYSGLIYITSDVPDANSFLQITEFVSA